MVVGGLRLHRNRYDDESTCTPHTRGRSHGGSGVRADRVCVCEFE